MLLSLQTFGQDVVYNFNSSTENFVQGGMAGLTATDGVLVNATWSGGFQFVRTPAGLAKTEANYKKIRVVVENSTDITVFQVLNYDSGSTSAGTADKQDVTIAAVALNSGFTTYDIDFPANSSNNGTIDRLGFRAKGAVTSGTLRIAQIVLIETGNWVTNNNFETSTDWTASGADVTAGFTTTDPQEGTQSGTLTFTADQVGTKFLQSATTDFGETVSPTDINTTLWVKSTTPGAVVSLVYSLKNATGAYLGQISTGNHTISTADTWELATFNKSNLTNTFNQVLLKIKVVGGLSGTVISFDDVKPTAILVATDNSWTGGKDTEWTDIANWTNGVAPTATKDSNVQVSANNPIISATTSAAVKNLDVGASATLTVASGGSLIVSGTSSGNVTYKRNLAPTNWYLVSSPVVGETYDDAYVTANSIDSGTEPNRGIAPYTTSDDSWNYMQAGASAATFAAGTGYSVKRSTAGDISFTGTLNVADAGVDVDLDATGNGFNLLGNPYTSHIASATFLDNESDISDTKTLWVWNLATGAYEVKTLADAMVIAPAQGFFVKANGTGSTFNFAESNQAGSGGTFQRTETRPEIYLTLSDQTDAREAKIYYIDNMTTGFDVGYEGELFNGVSNPLAIYTHLIADSQGKNYQVQSLPPNNYENMIIPVGVNANAGKEITFSAEALNLPDGIKVFLEDRLANTFNELSDNKTFKVNLSEALNDVGRFYLHTSSNALSIDDSVILENVSIYKTNASILKIVGLPNGIANIKLINVLGKQLMNTSFNANGAKEIYLPNLAAGIYIVQLETEFSKLNKKIVLE